VRIEDEVTQFLTAGVAAIVATRDDQLRPQIVRAWGVSVSTERTELTLCVEAPDGSPTRANLEGNGSVAATFSQPTTYRTVQIKGEAVALAEPTAEQLAAVEEHLEAFGREVEQVGMPADAGRRLIDRRLVAVSLAVRELYDQTPGPNAGAPL
jgi:hypothetical protein